MIDEWRDITISELDSALQSVLLDNDQEAAYNLICYFHHRFDDIGQDACPEGSIGILCQYMQHVFEKIIVEKWTPEQALGLKKRRGKYPRPDTTERDHILAANVILLMRKGKKWEDAIGDTANLISDSKADRLVQTAYSSNKELINQCNFSIKDLEDFISQGSPVIKELMAD